jgi:hypothetical protein
MRCLHALIGRQPRNRRHSEAAPSVWHGDEELDSRENGERIKQQALEKPFFFYMIRMLFLGAVFLSVIII